MSFYVQVFQNEEDDSYGAALRVVSGPFKDDDTGIDYEESTLLLAFGPTVESALLQLRAQLNAALGAVELDILIRRGATKLADAISDEISKVIELADEDVWEVDADGGDPDSFDEGGGGDDESDGD